MGEDIIDNLQWMKDLAIATVELEDEIIINNTSEIKLETNYPYLIFKRDDLIRTMNLCSKIVQQKSDISAYNSISFVTDISKKTIYFYSTNELAHFRYKTELLGDINEMLNEDFSISLNILQKLVKLMGSKILIYKKENNYYIRLLNGDLLIDVRPVDKNIINFPGEEQGKLADIHLVNIGTIVNAILPLLQSEIRNEAKRILFTGEKAYFKSSFYYVESTITTPAMSLSIRDAEFINKLYKYYRTEQIQLFRVASSLPRILLKLDNIEYQFINSVNSISNLMIQQMQDLVSDIESLIDFNKFYRIVNLATTLPDSTGNVELNYENDKLNTILTSVKGNSVFSFDIDKQVDNLYRKSVLVRAEILKRLLSSFNNSDKIGIALTSKSINIEYKNIKAIMMHNS